MGGKSSTLVIKIDQPHGIPGETLSGRIYLDIRTDRVDAESLILRFVGQEYTCARWTETVDDGDGKSHTEQRSTHQFCKFLDTAYPVASQGNFTRGQYEYPFSIVIPTGINQSMSAALSGSDGGECSISYYLQAKLHRRGWMKWDIHAKIPVLMIQRPVPFTGQYPAYVSPQSHRVTTCCCFNRGEMVLGLHTPTAYLRPGDNFQISYLLQNSSSVSIKAIEIGVFERIAWSANGTHRVLDIPLFHRRLEKQQVELDTTAINTKQPNAKIGDLIADVEALTQLKQALDSMKYVVPAVMGNTSRAQMRGTLIEVSHYLSMKVCTPFGTSNPFISTAVTVQPHAYALPPSTGLPIVSSEGTPTQLPPDWKPMISEPVAVPIATYVSPVTANSEPADNGEYHLASAAVTVKTLEGVPALLSAIRTTYYPLGEVSTWLQHNSADILDPQDFESLYQSINRMSDQMELTDMLLECRTSLTCQHIAMVVKSLNSVLKTDVVRKMSGKCSDKQNCKVIENQMLPFDWYLVKDCFLH